MIQNSRPSNQQPVIQASWLSDRGRVRNHNEDAVLAEYPVYLVADGMGGHDAGDVASGLTVALFRTLVGRLTLTSRMVMQTISRAQHRVRELAGKTQLGAGTTVSGLAIVSETDEFFWMMFNIGDSRVYRLHAGELQQLTTDHSVVQELLDDGRISPQQAESSTIKNVITRALGDESGEADFWLYPVVTGERMLVCSDGLSGELNSDELKSLLLYSGSTSDTAEALMSAALERGGRDNISLIVLDVLSGGSNAGAGIETKLVGDRVATPPVYEGGNGYDDELTQEIPGRSAR